MYAHYKVGPDRDYSIAQWLKSYMVVCQTVKFVLCAGNTQSLHFSCADAAYVGMQSMESTLVLPNPFQAVKLLAFINRNCI